MRRRFRPPATRYPRIGAAASPAAITTAITTVVLAFVLVLASAVAGCGSDDPTITTVTTAPSDATTVTPVPDAGASTTAPADATTSSSTTTTGAVTDPEDLSSAETLLPNGNIRAMGFIDQIRFSGTRNYVRIDYAEMLSGDEAVAAAIEAGVIDPGEDLPNDYFISNLNPQRREFAVSDAVTITTSTWGGEMERPVTWDVFRSFWSLDPPPDATHLRDAPWWIERQGETIVRIDEQYLP